MSLPAVNITEIDGALGVLPPSSGKLHALVGVSSKGPINLPASYGRTKDIIATFGEGPLVEAACHYVDRYGRAAIVVRTAATEVGTVTAVVPLNAAGDGPATGTTVCTASVDTATIDDQELGVKFLNDGTFGTAGITYQLTYDGGRSYGAVQTLGAAAPPVDIKPPGTGVKLSFAAGTVKKNERYRVNATAPHWGDTDLSDALNVLKTTAMSWEIVQIVGAIEDANAFNIVDLMISGMQAAGRPRAWVGNTRVPNTGETEAQYLAALSTAFSTKATTFGMLCAGACKLTSSVSGRTYRRPISMAVAARQAAVSEEINIAAVDVGALAAVSVRDSNGNIDEHDEAINPGLDDARFTTLRTWDGYQGVYVTRPRMFCAEGSDFQVMPHRRVINLGEIALRVYLIHRVNRPILVNRTTGFILETEALDIEAGANAVLAGELLVKPKASNATFVLARNDNVLSSKTLNGDARITPLAMPEFINVTVGYLNPAMQIVAV